MDDVLSSRRQKALAQRARSQQLRLKDMQVAEKRFLDLKLLRIAWDKDKTETSIQRDIRMLNDELRQNRRIQEDDFAEYEDVIDAVSIIDMRSEAPRGAASAISRDRAMRVLSAPAMTTCVRELEPRIGFGNVKWRLSRTKIADRPRCSFDQRQAHCPHFPCSKPAEYHHIGFDIRTDGRSRPRFSTSTQTAVSAREVLLDELESKSVRRLRRSTLDQCRIKEKALKKLITDMKARSESNRPKDWCTNYGVPTSRRKILKAARPTSMEDFQGIL
ncbi:hypothetical protein LSH36_154g03009 [Paralvinella palmiformis]|uniref:Uncharacterized protein n=1 Tax=Paralvinella palmiformis TaxID=53620 RepID=A0AAD9N8I6_9ANNE|nr:hypothetical protein LSH36_154g03009 [Paralvinella palmiformis]